MKVIRILLVLVLLAALAVGGFAALYWKRLLSTDQKVRYGLFEAAADDYWQAVLDNPGDPAALGNYVDSLVTMGNLSRAEYLSELYGVDSPRMAGLREVIDRALQAEADRQALNFSAEPAVAAEAGLPVREALRYLEGYQHALLGDWASARNHFAAVDTGLLAPALRPYHQYYLARSYRMAGDEEQRTEVEGLYVSVAGSSPDRALAARARYYLIEWYLSDDYNGDRVLAAARQFDLISAEDSVWALQKGHLEFADFFSGGDDSARAWEHASQALVAGPVTTVGNTAAKLCLELLAQQDNPGLAELKLPDGFYPALAEAGVRFGYGDAAASTLLRLKSVRDLDSAELGGIYAALSICHLESGDLAALGQLANAPGLGSFDAEHRAQVQFNHGMLLKQKEKWSSSIAAFLHCADCETELAPEALYQAYSVLKRVQARIDRPRAEGFLNRIIEQYPRSDAYLKAVEELIPLLIYSGEQAKARNLCSRVSKHAGDSDDPGRQRAHGHALQVAQYWLAYLARRKGNSDEARSLEAQIGLKYWNYFELTSNYPPHTELSDQPAVISRPGHAGEYFLGLGLAQSAQDAYSGLGKTGDDLLRYFDMRNYADTKPVSSRQWHATEILEDGEIGEQTVLDYMLAEAYPLPFAAEISSAADEFKVSEALIYAIIKKETNFKPESVSWVGAEGLMQLMPATARWLNNRYSLHADLNRVRDPKVNIRLGAAYIRSLMDDLGENNIRGVIHTYNGGPGNYKTWQENYPCDQVLFTDVVPNEQNETYAKKVIKYYKVYDWLLSRD